MIRISLGVDDYYTITWYIILSDTKTYYDFNRGPTIVWAIVLALY